MNKKRERMIRRKRRWRRGRKGRRGKRQQGRKQNTAKNKSQLL